MEEILAKIKKLTAEQLGMEESEISDTASFEDDLGADSLDIVELTMAIEEEFDIEIPDGDAEKISNIAHATKYVADAAK